jgi:hypothetical protein
VYGTVRGFRLKQDLRAGYPYALRTDNPEDVIRGTLLTWAPLANNDTMQPTCAPDLDIFYDRLQVCNLIEAHDASGLTPSLYERCHVEVTVDVSPGQPVGAYLYYMNPSVERLQWSLDIPAGDWLEQVRSLRGDDLEDLAFPV